MLRPIRVAPSPLSPGPQHIESIGRSYRCLQVVADLRGGLLRDDRPCLFGQRAKRPIRAQPLDQRRTSRCTVAELKNDDVATFHGRRTVTGTWCVVERTQSYHDSPLAPQGLLRQVLLARDRIVIAAYEQSPPSSLSRGWLPKFNLVGLRIHDPTELSVLGVVHLLQDIASFVTKRLK